MWPYLRFTAGSHSTHSKGWAFYMKDTPGVWLAPMDCLYDVMVPGFGVSSPLWPRDRRQCELVACLSKGVGDGEHDGRVDRKRGVKTIRQLRVVIVYVCTCVCACACACVCACGARF